MSCDRPGPTHSGEDNQQGGPPPEIHCAMMREVHLGGRLGKKYGKVHRFDIATPAEAFRAFEANYPGFLGEMLRLGSQGYGYRILHGNKFKHGIASPEDLRQPCSGPIRITPEIVGAKNAGIGQLLLAAVIIYASVQTGGLAAAAGTGSGAFGMSAASLTQASSVLMSAGLSMGLGGVVQLLSPQQATNTPIESTTTPSYVFDGAVNTMAQGHPVPVGYGEMIVGSAVISASIDVEQVQITGTSDNTTQPTYTNAAGQTVPYPAPTVFWDNNLSTWSLPDGTLFAYDEQISGDEVTRANYRLSDGRTLVHTADPNRWDVQAPTSFAVFKRLSLPIGKVSAWTVINGAVQISFNEPERRWEAANTSTTNTQ